MFSDRTYIAADWAPLAKDKFYDDKCAEVRHDGTSTWRNFGLRTPDLFVYPQGVLVLVLHNFFLPPPSVFACFKQFLLIFIVGL